MVKFSVVTVCYNAALTIEETILSVVKQTYPSVEYLIIDGNSTDGTPKIVEQYKDKIAYFISEPDKGIYDAMNKALKVATGDFLIFLGADDHFISYQVLEQVAAQITDSNSIYYGNVFRNTRNDIYKGRFNKYKISLENICHQSIFYPQTAYKKYFYSLEYKVYADYYYNLTLFPAFSFVYIPITISYFNVGGFSSKAPDANFNAIVNKYVLKQNGFLAWLLRQIYLIYKKLR